MNCHQKAAGALLCTVTILLPLLFGGCRAKESGPTSWTASSLLEPLIVIASTDYDKATIHLTWLNDTGNHQEIVAENLWDVSQPVMDKDANIYLPVKSFDPLGKGNVVLYIVPRQGSPKRIALDTEEIYTAQECYGRMIFAGHSVHKIVIMDRDFSYKIVRLETSDPGIGIGGLVKGQENEVIAFSERPVRLTNGEQTVQVFIIDLNSGQVSPKLLPAPPSEELSEAPASPTVKYNLMLVGASQDLKKLYYTYLESQEAADNVLSPKLGAFDTALEKEVQTYGKSGLCPEGYRQYKEYLFISHVPEAGGSALLLNLQALSPVIEPGESFKGYTLIHPVGKYFIVGTWNKVTLISQGGRILKEYPLPPDLTGKGYTVVEYLGDD